MIGVSARRKEDGRLLVGHGRYLDDLTRAGLVHLGIVRSLYAHARIAKVDLADARAMPGVVAAFTASDLPECAGPMPRRVLRFFRAFDRPILATDKVRHVGEAIAVVVADDRYRLADAIAAVTIEYEELEPVVRVEDTARPGGPTVHDGWPDNVAGVNRASVGDVERGLAEADLVLDERFHYPRGAAMPIETRGVIAEHDPLLGTTTVWSSTQTTHLVRDTIATVLEVSAESVRVVAPDVGGAFGAKAQVYCEEVLVPVVARRIGRPVKWVETRREHFLAGCQDRDQTHAVRMGFKADGTITAIDDAFQKDFGAYAVQEDGVTANTVVHLPGPYKVPHYRCRADNVFTNKAFSAAYRGAGRPEAALVIDRMLDIAARRLGLDPAEIRRRNLVRPDEMPYRPGLTYKDGTEVAYDPGDYPADFETMLELLDYAGWRERQARQVKSRRRVGIGLSCYAHGTGLGPFEGANVRVDPNGKVYVFIGVGSQGQGHATTLAQICAEELGVALDDVQVVGADTQALPYGIGVMASRVMTNSGPAVARAAREVRGKAIAVAASLLECAPEDVVLDAGRLHVAGVPAKGLALSAVARAAVRSKALADVGPGLNGCTYFYPDTVTWAFGGGAAAVEVDLDTCQIEILRYVAIHDPGRAVNPMIVEGQIHGGLAQGLGAALGERLIYDDHGQLVTGSFMDYGLPRADQLPSFTTALIEHRSVRNELGVKGVGESGTISPAAVIANAVEDALSGLCVTIREVPVTPSSLFELLHTHDSTGGHA